MQTFWKDEDQNRCRFNWFLQYWNFCIVTYLNHFDIYWFLCVWSKWLQNSKALWTTDDDLVNVPLFYIIQKFNFCTTTSTWYNLFANFSISFFLQTYGFLACTLAYNSWGHVSAWVMLKCMCVNQHHRWTSASFYYAIRVLRAVSVHIHHHP